MGFLDDLKKQAGDLRAQQDSGQQARMRSLQLVEAAGRGLRHYLIDLAQTLQSIRPAPAVRYTLDRAVVLQGLPREDFRFDARRTIRHDQEVIDHLQLFAQVGDGRRVGLAKDFVNEIEQIERRLTQSGAAHEREAVRDPADGRLIEMRYDFEARVRLATVVRCLHDEGCLHFSMRNLDGLETVDCVFPAHEVTQARMDELARWWVGEPHRFLDGAQQLRRTEAR